MSLRSILKSHLTPAAREILKSIKSELEIGFIHASGIAGSNRFKGRKDLKLNCGGGMNVKAGWINIDLTKESDLRLDLRKPLPFEDASVVEIYSEHFLEHLRYPEEAETFLKESFRVLVPGGVIRLRVPDTTIFLKAYLDGDKRFFDINAEFWRPDDCKTLMQCLNVHMREGHNYCYDFETLSLVLSNIGFCSIEKGDFEPELDSEARRHETLYVNARKPG